MRETSGRVLTGETTLTPAMLRAALLQLGVAASAENVQIAQAFAQFGLALTAMTITEAHVGLAQAPGASPAAYALAKSLGLTASPSILRALSTITEGIPERRTLPLEVTEWLSLAVAGDQEPESLAAQLHLMVNQRSQSTERSLLAAGDNRIPENDLRATLMRLAQNSGDKQIRLGADSLASHIEGQQLINLATQREQTLDQTVAQYFALPLMLPPAEQTMLEMSVWRREETAEDDAEMELEETAWRTTIRLATTRLGRIEAELVGSSFGALTCRVSAEKPATIRLLQRGREKLASALTDAGWTHCDVTCQAKTDWSPLWHGGKTLTAPRTRVDWEA
jgi:hypothetical protein